MSLSSGSLEILLPIVILLVWLLICIFLLYIADVALSRLFRNVNIWRYVVAHAITFSPLVAVLFFWIYSSPFTKIKYSTAWFYCDVESPNISIIFDARGRLSHAGDIIDSRHHLEYPPGTSMLTEWLERWKGRWSYSSLREIFGLYWPWVNIGDKSSSPPNRLYAHVSMGPLIIVALIGPVWMITRTLRRRAGDMECLNCFYSLRGNTTGMCPECGTPIPSSQIDRINQTPKVL